MTTFNHTILRELLNRYGKTIEDFARDLGVSVSTASRWLNGHHKPNKLTRKAIENLLQDYQTQKESAA